MSYNGKDVNLFTNGKAVTTDNRLPVDSTGSVSITGTVPLPTGAATSAKQDTGNSSLSSIDGKIPATVGGKVPVDASGSSVSVTGTVPLPTGAATSAKQDTGNTSLSSIDGKLPSLVNSRLPITPSGTLVSEVFDFISANYAGATTDVYTYKSGGSGGTTVATITITYTDSTKGTISTVART